MAFKSVLILASIIGLVCSANSHCNPIDGGIIYGQDCTCADRAFSECLEPPPSTNIFHVNTFEECWAQCHLWTPFPSCDWFLFDSSAEWDENCRLFVGPEQSLAGYLSTCNLIGMPTRMANDTCIADPSADGLLGSICESASMCPDGCTTCAGDRCSGYVETGCVMMNQEIDSAPNPTFEDCQAFAISSGMEENIITYFTFDQQYQLCRLYGSGERSCNFQIAAEGMDLDDIQTCTEYM